MDTLRFVHPTPADARNEGWSQGKAKRGILLFERSPVPGLDMRHDQRQADQTLADPPPEPIRSVRVGGLNPPDRATGQL